VVLATPAYVSADLIAGLAPALSAELKRIRYVSTATISLGFHRADLARPLDGFGYVTARGEGRPVFACTWTSTKFNHRAPEGNVLLRCFVGGHGSEELLAYDDQELIALVCRELAATVGPRAQPRLAKVFRWPRGAPQYDLGHLDRIRAIRAECKPYAGLCVAGSAYDGIGVPDCVRQAQQAAKHVLAYLGQGIGS
jgi:oxygen-dependent protoporphyrinogen oxidase